MPERPQFEQKTEQRQPMDDGLSGGRKAIPPNWVFAVRPQIVPRADRLGAGYDRERAGRIQ